MTHFQFSNYFIQRRKELKVTQEQVAQYVGVSKAAISKWEKGQSYPDISLLPKLATYFNVSIDELLGYEPQMTAQKIAELYAQFAESFNEQSFEDVQQQIEQYVTEYYSCFPFVLKMAQLYLNYYPKAQQPELVLQRIAELCTRVIEMSGNKKLMDEAHYINAFIKILQNEPQKTLELLGDEPKIHYGEDQLKATAHIMLGNVEKAQEILQISHFQHLMSMMASATESLLIHQESFDETVKRMLMIIDVYDLEKLHINTALVFYIKAAMGYMQQQRHEEAIAIIEKYVKASSQIRFPLKLIRKDAYFSLLEQWMMAQSAIGTQAPRSDEVIKRDLYGTIAHNPIFAPIRNDQRVKSMLSNLYHHLQLKEEQQ